MKSTTSLGNSQFLRKSSTLSVLAITILLLVEAFDVRAAGPNLNPGVLPPHAKPRGKTYGEWGAAWMAWSAGIPAAENPYFDATGEFGSIDQAGPVWFLAGTLFGGTVERTLTVPKGKALFFPLLESLWWAPNDLPLAAVVAEEFLGLDPDTLSDEELIRLLVRFHNGPDAELTLTIDGVAVENLQQYRADSPAFHLTDTDLIDDLGVPIAEDNLAVADGYWIMLAPLSPGSHVIHFTGSRDNTLLGPFEQDVTYHLLVQ